MTRLEWALFCVKAWGFAWLDDEVWPDLNEAAAIWLYVRARTG